MTFSASGTGGVVVLGLPTYTTGTSDNTSGPSYGLEVGGSLEGTLTDNDDWDVILGSRFFGVFGHGSSSYTDTFDANDSGVVIVGTSAPGGAAAINETATGGGAAVTATGANGGTANVLTAGGATNNVAAVTPDGTGFVMSSVTSTGATGAAYSGIGSSSGGIFIATGDIDGLTVTTSSDQQFLYGGIDLTVGLAGHPTDGTVVKVYAGPSLRGIADSRSTSLTVDIPEVQPSLVTHPQYAMTTTDQITSSYLGGIIGGSLSFPSGDSGPVFTLGLEGGAYNVNASWTGQDTYSTCCGDITTPLATPSPTISVDGPSNSADFNSTIAFMARGSGAVTWAIDDNKSFSLGGDVEYLSSVANVNHDFVQTGTDGTYVAGDDAAGTTFTWGSMINYSVKGSLTGHF